MSSFFAHVYQVVEMIPFGQVATYGQIARIVSHKGAARTVGWALNALPEATNVPWHRVINARGEISQRDREGDAADQRELLEREGVRFSDGRTDLPVYQWEGLEWPEIEALHHTWEKESSALPSR
jgi:methylated-DNA-protein-cysteine methyltransferase related protein